jgi:glucose/arabinose dehydrogenase
VLAPLASCSSEGNGASATVTDAGDAGADADADAAPPVDYDPPASCPAGVPKLKLTPVVTRGLSQPLYVVAPPGDDDALIVLEKTGLAKVVRGGAVEQAPFLDLTRTVTTSSEQGLLGLAFHPDYARNGRLWVSYTTGGGGPAGRSVIAEYKRDDATSRPTFVKELLSIDQPYANHNGGMIAFGPDGFLYIGMGDGGDGGDPQNFAQNPSSQLGSMLRVDVDRYPTPPAGNLTTNNADPQTWDYGLRNPWRFSFDRKTGDLYIADVGQNELEEINVEPANTGKRNYGWKCREGDRPFSMNTPGCSTATLTPPVLTYGRGDGQSVTGGYVYRGKAIPCLRGRYLYGDFGSRRIWSFVWDGAAGVRENVELTSDLNPGSQLSLQVVSFGEDNAGELYVVAFGGAVYRIEPE